MYFRDKKEVIYTQFIPWATTINSNTCATLRRLPKAGRHVDLSRSEIIEYANANTPHFWQNSRNCPFAGTDQPTCCLDLAPMNYCYFLDCWRDRRFHGNEELKMALRKWVRMPQPYFQRHGNFKRLPTWHDGISELGYAGKWLHYTTIHVLYTTLKLSPNSHFVLKS